MPHYTRDTTAGSYLDTRRYDTPEQEEGKDAPLCDISKQQLRSTAVSVEDVHMYRPAGNDFGLHPCPFTMQQFLPRASGSQPSSTRCCCPTSRQKPESHTKHWVGHKHWIQPTLHLPGWLSPSRYGILPSLSQGCLLCRCIMSKAYLGGVTSNCQEESSAIWMSTAKDAVHTLTAHRDDAFKSACLVAILKQKLFITMWPPLRRDFLTKNTRKLINFKW